MMMERTIILKLIVLLAACIASLGATRMIRVRGPNGQEEFFPMEQVNSVFDLKTFICRQFSIPRFAQKLSVNGTELLGDKKRLRDFKLWRYDAVDLAKSDEMIQVTVVLDGKDIGQIEADGSELIGSLERRISLKFGISPISLAIGQELPRDSKLAEYVSETGRLKIRIRKLESFREKPCKVELSTGGHFNILLTQNYTVGNIKAIIESQLNIPLDDQRLFMGDVELAEDNIELADYPTWEKQTFKVVTSVKPKIKLELRLMFEPTNFSLEITLDEPAENIRSMISELLNVDRWHVIFGYNIESGRFRQMLDGSRFSEYIADSILAPSNYISTWQQWPREQWLTPTIVGPDGPRYGERLRNDLLIRDLLPEIVRRKSDLYLNDLKLSFDRRLIDYNIHRNVILREVPRALGILTLFGDSIYLESLDKIERVIDLKTIIKEQWGFQIAAQRLFYLGNELRDDQLLLEDFDSLIGAKMYLATKREQDYEYLKNLEEIMCGDH